MKAVTMTVIYARVPTEIHVEDETPIIGHIQDCDKYDESLGILAS